MRPRLRLFAAAAPLALAAGVVALPSATAAAASTNRTVRVTVTAPAGVPASVTLEGALRYVAAKPATGTSTLVPLTVAPGAYKVLASPMTFGGKLYVPQASRPEIPASGPTLDLSVTYTLNPVVQDLHVESVTRTAVSLAWTALRQDRVTVRRTTGTVPAKAPDQGVDVPVSGATATDGGLQPGTRYTYALFTQGKGKWVGPMALQLATASNDPAAATYAAAPGALLLAAPDVVSAQPTGDGVRLVVGAGVAPPVLGAGVVLPVLPSVPGGYLGVVADISADGRTLALTGGSLSDAFDYYDVDVPNFKGSIDGDAAAPATAKTTTAKTTAVVATAAAGASGLVTCFSSKGGVAQEFTYSPKVSFSGHFSSKLDKYKVLDKDLPKGASLDLGFVASASGPATLKTTGELRCERKMGSLDVLLAETPVPMWSHFAPTAGFTIGGAVEVSNAGLTVNAGLNAKVSMGLTSELKISTTPVLSATALTPKVVRTASVGVKLGGQVIVGPGAITEKAGVIAGVSGEFYPIDASFGAVFPETDTRYNACLKLEAKVTAKISLTAKAWLGNWDLTKSATLWDFGTPVAGSPWYLPSGCKDAAEPGDSVLGNGVTKVDDKVQGSQDQWGYVPGFVPGSKTWVLSTGKIYDAVGSPGQFASTGLNLAGDAQLSALSGQPTFDAVSYTVTLVPTKPNLHVRYVFASEEYPEFVGSKFNDVMAVFVGGTNCALVPGATEPVSVNTVNEGHNAAYYVNNSAGAAGYGTTMDGLTKPLTCTVPVTVGKPVTVRIALADASDDAYDSAVALLDQGIWAD